jgi:hypothetical protein
MMGCVEPFRPSISLRAINVLVIDGFVNATDSTMEVILSRAASVTSSDSSYAESGAQVAVQPDIGFQYYLTETAAGVYTSKKFISPAYKYKLTVTTQDQRKYSSDFIDILEAPPIDSVYWRPMADGVALYVDAHDTEQAARYYRWTFDETWKYRTPYYVYKKWLGGQIIDVPPANNICWNSGSSTEILVYSTQALKENLVSKFQVNFLPMGNQKLSAKYSINVNQRAINANIYNYWQQLQTKTQNLGSLFDVLPTQIIGNVHSDTDPAEIVLGYFSGSTVTSKRIFIDTLELPPYLQHWPAYYNCPPDTVYVNELSKAPDGTLFFNSWNAGGAPAGYIATNTYCMDCRLSGGKTEPPSFWK